MEKISANVVTSCNYEVHNKMKRMPIRKRSSRKKLIDSITDLFRASLIFERGRECEICGSQPFNLGVFHILPVGQYPRMRFTKANVLLSCWEPCHHLWHHDRDLFRKKNKFNDRPAMAKLSEEYINELKKMNVTMPTMTLTRLGMLKMAYELAVKEIME